MESLEHSPAVQQRVDAYHEHIRTEEPSFIAHALTRFVAAPAVRLWKPAEITGLEHVPDNGPFILAANHTTDIEPPIIGAHFYKLRRADGSRNLLRPLTKEEMITPETTAANRGRQHATIGGILTARYMMAIHAPVINRSEGKSEAGMVSALTALQAGHGILIYPEGTRTERAGALPMKGKPGVAKLALESGAPVIPLAHVGTEQSLDTAEGERPHASYSFGKTIHIRLGEPLDIGKLTASYQTDRTKYVRGTQFVMEAITSQLLDLRAEIKNTAL